GLGSFHQGQPVLLGRPLRVGIKPQLPQRGLGGPSWGVRFLAVQGGYRQQPRRAPAESKPQWSSLLQPAIGRKRIGVYIC
ncbi:MAG: hypothetical protein ACK56I_05175, partial [bacterium]